MNLNKYMSLNEEHTLLPDEVQALNADLAVRSPSDIPEEYRPRVTDYILDVLNMGSVEPPLIPSIEKLLQGLRQDS
jgi:hypothetical protein